MAKILKEGKASDLAHKLGLEYVGYGYWAKNGKIVAKTVKDNLVKTSAKDEENFKNKKQKIVTDLDKSAAAAPWPSGPHAHDAASIGNYEGDTSDTKGTPENILHKKVSNATGTNPGGVYEGKDGVLRYAKFYKDSGKSFGEVLADSLYNDVGVEAPKAQYFQHDGNVGFASDMVDGVTDLKNVWDAYSNLGKSKLAKKILDGFAADCLMANWDVVGVNEGFMRNIVVMFDPEKTEDEKVIRIDNGSAFLCRGLEGRKADAYGEDVLYNLTEPEQFTKKNPSYKEVFAASGYKEVKNIPNLKQQVASILAVHNKAGGWQKYIEAKIPDIQGKDKEQIIKMLYLRTKQLIELVKGLP